MKMDIAKLQEIQGGLDPHIIKQHPDIAELDNNDWKFLALQVELGELANETRCFKVWSNKPPSEREVIREEYVDGYHFILSLGNDLYIDAEKMTPMDIEFEDVTRAFLKIYDLATGLQRNVRNDYGNNHKYLWRKLFFSYLELGRMLGFTEDEIEKGYLAKNEKNHNRQLSGY
ncbi:dUTP diphosphatase [Salimicrobium album]|uniref:Dimeric dUTPase, all-alpha-NTP-PPase (MazG) superfamily n=1 Tax=Salimicrobium album TaxID=50717 RepID=A0A1H3D8D3_9BACI|nr:dUTP diphosphatase [Salimicrobium album]SDX62014.1 Dimeric dUTPase, all-alpha-NTP-PPase (MazG) superfamily [Salimicrobium album]